MLVLKYESITNPFIDHLFNNMTNLKNYFYTYHNIDNNGFINSDDKLNLKVFLQKNSKVRNICRKFIIKCY